jgi:hypothetical protein
VPVKGLPITPNYGTKAKRGNDYKSTELTGTLESKWRRGPPAFADISKVPPLNENRIIKVKQQKIFVPFRVVRVALSNISHNL